MLRFAPIIAGLILLSVLAGSCRKGEDDPFLSLRSRKARVAGAWSMTDGSGSTVTTFPGSTITESWTSDGASRNYTTAYTDTSGTFTSSYSEDYKFLCSFDKDGTFVLTEKINMEVTTKRGTWNFNEGPGKEARTQLLLTVSWEMLTFGSVQTYEGANRPVEVFGINELRHKKMVLIKEGASTDQGSTVTKKATIVLGQE